MSVDIDRLERRKLEGLYHLAVELLHLEEYDRMLDAVARHALESLGAERGFIALRRGQDLDFKVVRNWSREELEGEGEPISRTIMGDVLRSGEPLLIEDALSDERFAEQDSILRHGIRSVAAAPLVLEGETVGVLYLESRSLDRLLGESEFELFRHILELSSRALESCTRRLLLEQRNTLLERDLLARYKFPGIVTRSPALLKVLETVGQVATSELPVLVQGPSGTGKELIARALHLNSKRSRKAFVIVNCGAISPNLLESELFGHVRGAFTGATRDKAGLIPSADGGTLFLDEVGELPKELQVKLLRTLQFGEVLPVGSTRPQTVDVRFVAATNRVLEDEVEKGRFREDLFYRLNAITLDLPPLKERPEDILLLFHHFLKQTADKLERPVPPVTPRLERALARYAWPGNVRDLENEARRLLAITPEGVTLSAEDLSPRILSGPGEGKISPLASLSEREKEQIEHHLRLADGNRTRAAKSLGISREGLRKKMKRLGLS